MCCQAVFPWIFPFTKVGPRNPEPIRGAAGPSWQIGPKVWNQKTVGGIFLFDVFFWGEEKWTKHQVVDQEKKWFFSLRKFKHRHLEKWIRYMHIEMIFTDLPILEIPNTSILDCKKKSKASSSKLAVSWFNLQGYKTYLLSWPCWVYF